DPGPPFVRHPKSVVAGVGKWMVERDRAVLDNPPPDHDVRERVAVIEKVDRGTYGNCVGPQTDDERYEPHARPLRVLRSGTARVSPAEGRSSVHRASIG